MRSLAAAAASARRSRSFAAAAAAVHSGRSRPGEQSHRHVPEEKQEQHYEVERKFKFDPSQLAALERNAGPTKFQSVQFVAETCFTDVYFDAMWEDRFPLTRSDIWLRRRDGKWECKVPMDLTGTMDSYHEITDMRGIWMYLTAHRELRPAVSVQRLQELHARVEESTDAASAVEFEALLREAFKLDVFATINTKRREYVLDDQYTLDLDTASFGHSVGEIELVVNEREQVPLAEKQILQFCSMHRWFFDTDSAVKGKLLEYIDRYNPTQWQCLAQSGLLAKKLNPDKYIR